MPLLHRKPFVRQKPPQDLRPDEEVFLCKVTHEIFRTYDEFFERTILCNSLVWSCALTGKPGLTYLEALESEKRARQSLQSFPATLVLPLFHLTALTHRSRLTELCDDIYAFVKDRFFPGEIVDVAGRNGARLLCEILEVQSPNSNGMAAVNGHAKPPADGDTIVISDSDEESSAPKTPKPQLNGSKKKKPSSPSVYKYRVKLVRMEGTQSSEPFVVKANQISRKKNTFSRERLKLLLKQHCEPQYGTIVLKQSTILKYKLAEQTFSDFFPDEPPQFPFSPPAKGQGRRPGDSSPGQLSSKLLKAAEEKLKLMQQKEEMQAVAQEKAKMRREKEDALEAKKKEREDKEKLREEMRRRFEEEKQKRKEDKERMKLEKDREREKLKEEKKKYAERLKLWNKPREDMECEDLKELPCPVPVKTRLPAELFGEALLVLEFLKAFGELFDLKDEFPDGVSLEVLEEAMVGSDPEGPLCELLFFFLSAIFQALAEEQEEVAKDQVAEDLSEALDDDADPTQSAISAVASLAAAWPQLHQGCSLKQLDLDSCTLSEILRLHILASGADCNHGNAKFRYQKQGGFISTDDPCVELRLANPGLLKRLACTSVYDLTPGDKLKILHALCGKLLTLVSTRDFIEDSAEEQRAAKHVLRDIKTEQHRREREEAAHRVRVRKEERLREQEMRLREMQEKHERLKEQEAWNGLPGSSVEDLNASTESHGGHHTEDEEEQGTSNNNNKGKANQKEKHQTASSSGGPPPRVSLTPEELEEDQEKVRELQERIQKAAACTYILPLGRDRLYRRYWLFPSACALFVEDDYFGVTEDMLEPQPASQEVKMEEEEEERAEDLSMKSPDSDSTASPSPAPVHASGPPVNRPNQWAFYSSAVEVEQLIEALNPRGHRENTLKEALMQEKERINQLLNNTAAEKYNYTDKPEVTAAKTSSSKTKPAAPSVSEAPAPADCFMENRLRDLLLDIEDRIYQGTLGTLKVMERDVWRAALEGGHYELLNPERKENGGLNGEAEPMEVDCNHIRTSNKDRLQELRGDGVHVAASGGSGTPQPANSTVRCLARALAQIEMGIERKFLKAPLGDEDSKKDQKTKKNKKRDEDQSSEDGSDSGRVCKTVLERWRDSLQACSSFSQVFLHLSSLEKSVVWAKSLLNARCKVCRRKGDAENMLLCDSCDRGYHLHCLRPKLKSVPGGDWFCPQCRPKQRANRLTSRQRSSVDSEEEVEEEDEEDEEEEEEDEEEESEEEEEEEDDEEEEESEEEDEEEEVVVSTKKGRAAVKLPPPKGGRSASSRSAKQGGSAQSTPRSQQTTPRTNTSTGRASSSKSSGKKATPSSSKPTPVSNGKPPPRAGSRISARLSHEVLAPPSTSKSANPSPAQNDSRKRALTEVTPSPKSSKSVLPVLTPTASSSSSSSSSRRSSGRNHGVHELSACEQLTVELVRHEDSWPFMKLVSKTQVPDYYDIIKKPIALSTIREKVNNCEYKTSAEYIEDVELMFSNCLQYNPRHTNEAKAGQRLQSFFNSEVNKLGLAEHTSPPQKRSRV